MKNILASSLSLLFMLGMMVPGLVMGQTSQSGVNAPLVPAQNGVNDQNGVNAPVQPNQNGVNSTVPSAPVAPVKSSAPITGGIQNPLKGVTSIADLFYTIVKLVYSLSYAVIAIFLIISGFKFVAAQGNEEKLTDAKNTFKYTIIGAILLIGANVITEVIRNVINQFSTNKI